MARAARKQLLARPEERLVPYTRRCSSYKPFLLDHHPRFITRLQSVRHARQFFSTRAAIVCPPLIPASKEWYQRMTRIQIKAFSREKKITFLIPMSCFTIPIHCSASRKMRCFFPSEVIEEIDRFKRQNPPNWGRTPARFRACSMAICNTGSLSRRGHAAQRRTRLRIVFQNTAPAKNGPHGFRRPLGGQPYSRASPAHSEEQAQGRDGPGHARTSICASRPTRSGFRRKTTRTTAF